MLQRIRQSRCWRRVINANCNRPGGIARISSSGTAVALAAPSPEASSVYVLSAPVLPILLSQRRDDESLLLGEGLARSGQPQDPGCRQNVLQAVGAQLNTILITMFAAGRLLLPRRRRRVESVASFVARSSGVADADDFPARGSALR